MLIDKYNRIIDNLRISVTNECNLRCFFCHREGNEGTEDVLTPEDIEFIVKVAAKLGIKKIKITGGEPLIRNDIVNIVEKISRIRGIEDISLTTNGTLLREKASKLRKAGLKRINISLHSLREDTYRKITGKDLLKNVLKGIEAVLKCNYEQVKVNVVVLKGINDGELYDILNFARRQKVILQLIELETNSRDSLMYNNYHVSFTKIRSFLRRNSVRLIKRKEQNRPVFYLKNGGIVEIVNPMEDNSFCLKCTKLRITSDAKLKPCLFSRNYIDIAEIVKDRNEKELSMAFIHVLEFRRPFFVSTKKRVSS